MRTAYVKNNLKTNKCITNGCKFKLRGGGCSASKYLTTGFPKRKLWFALFDHLCGVNSPTMPNFKLPT